MNSKTLVLRKTSSKKFEIPKELVDAIVKALAIGTSREVVCKMANLSQKKFDKWVTVGQRLWELWHDGKRDFTLWEQGCMEFSSLVCRTEAAWLVKVQGAVDRGLDNPNSVAQGRYGMEILERRDTSSWGKKAVIKEDQENKLLNPSDSERIIIDDLATLRKEVAEQRSVEIKKRMDA